MKASISTILCCIICVFSLLTNSRDQSSKRYRICTYVSANSCANCLSKVIVYCDGMRIGITDTKIILYSSRYTYAERTLSMLKKSGYRCGLIHERHPVMNGIVGNTWLRLSLRDSVFIEGSIDD